MRVALVTVAVVLVAATAAAEVRGSYKRVGGWEYHELDGQPSCGKGARKDFRALVDRIREARVTKKKIYLGKHVLTVELHETDRVNAVDAQETKDGLIVLRASVVETHDGAMIFIIREAYPKDGKGDGCADNFTASFDQTDDDE